MASAPTSRSRGPRSRPATYGTATRLARIVHGLVGRPHGWSVEAICEELGISERTLLRYLAACRRELTTADGTPLIEVVRHGERRVLRLADSTPAPESTSYQALALYFALSLFRFLEGTILEQGVDDLWRRFYDALPVSGKTRLVDFDRKFFSIPYAMTDYRGFDDTLDVILGCLVFQRTMRIDYQGLWREGEGSVHDFDPYTLTMYRGGLYLIGRSHQYRKIIYLAVERIRRAEKLATRFDYPRRYSPSAHTEGTFGIVDGPETKVVLCLRTREIAALVSSRRVHPTQRFQARPDGTTLLSMTVRGTSELKNWILSLGAHVEVLAPDTLREDVGRELAPAAALYASAR